MKKSRSIKSNHHLQWNRIYKISMLIIGFFIIFNGLFIMEYLNRQQYDGKLINVAGRQRMLNQRIVKAANGINATDNEHLKESYLNEMVFALNLWTTTHESLLSDSDVLGFKFDKSESVRALFVNTQVYFDEVKAISNRIIMTERENQLQVKISDSDLSTLKNDSDFYLSIMDELVNQLEYESRTRNQSTIIIELISIIISVISVWMIYIVFFKPLEGKMLSAIEDTKKLFDIAPTAIVIIDPEDYVIKDINDAAELLLQINYSEALVMNFLDFISDNAKSQLEHFKLRSHENVIKGIEIDLISRERVGYQCLMSLGRFHYNEKEHLLIGLADITVQKQNEEAFERLATVDEMTGLFNRRTGLMMLAKEFEKAKRAVYNITVCFIDLDGLKFVNDTHGHNEGDWYIRTITTVIKEGVRQGDIAMRFGGDEMVVGFIDCDFEEAETSMKRIELVLDLIIEKEKKPYNMGISYGFSDYEKEKSMSLEAFINIADEEMYKVKSKKKTTRL